MSDVGSYTGGAITVSGAISKNMSDIIRAEWERQFTLKSGRVAVLEHGMKFERVADKLSDTAIEAMSGD